MGVSAFYSFNEREREREVTRNKKTARMVNIVEHEEITTEKVEKSTLNFSLISI